jgi:ribosomal protein S18 acetylase RimI-like enzyme
MANAVHGTEVLSLDRVPIGEAAEMLNLVYGGYAVPVQFTPASLNARILADHVDLTRSHAWIGQSGETLACVLVARRGRTARVAALGVAPTARGAGIGRQAMDKVIEHARLDGHDRIVLEVLTSNRPARRLYESVGFRPRSRLVGYDLAPRGTQPPACSIEACDVGAVLGSLLANYPQDVTWQVSPLSLAAATGSMQGFRSPAGAVAVVDEGPSGMRLAAIAVPRQQRHQGHGRALLAALTAAHPDQRWRIPAFVPEHLASEFFAATGWAISEITQVEMELVLR